MPEGERSRDDRRRWIAIALGAALLAAVLVARIDTDEPAALHDEPADPHSAEASPAEPAAGSGPAVPLATGATLVVERALLRPGEPLQLDLELPDVAGGIDVLSARMLSEASEETALEVRVADAGTSVQVSIDAAALPPGRYLIEIKTSERTHFPLRRYVLEIR